MQFLPGAEADWEAVYAQQLPRIFNYFRYRLGSDLDVEELTSRTFEKAWRSRALFRRDRAGFSTWLFTIAQNVATDHLRTCRVHAPLDAAAHVSTDDGPAQDAERSSDIARLAKLAARLPERERELIALKYGAGVSNREIAQVTGLSESNVGTILHRVVELLRSQWESQP